MQQSRKKSLVVAVRLAAEEHDAVAAMAAIEGKAVSTYIRDILGGARARPRPVLAAGGALLAICDALLTSSRAKSLDAATRATITDQARLIIDIVRLHEPEIGS